jgi:hypothetical protein
MKTYLPVVLVVGGVHLALIFVLTIIGSLSARNGLPDQGIVLPAHALQKECTLHRVARMSGAVQVTYGEPGAVAREYLEARSRSFPNAWFYVDGGLAATPDSPRQATVRYCPTCRATEQRWRAQFASRSTR